MIEGTIESEEGDSSIRIRTPEGALLSFERSQIDKIERLRPIQREYLLKRETTPDTVEGHLELAQWCAEHYLAEERKSELRRVIQLDPDNARARALLGYVKTEDGWKTRDEIMQAQGYVRYKGRWMLPQEVQILKEREAENEKRKEWTQKIQLWLAWLGTERSRVAEESLQSIRDPVAVPPLLNALKNAKDDHLRLMLVDVLGQIPSPESLRALAFVAIEDPLEEARLRAIEILKQRPSDEIVAFFAGQLKSNDLTRVHRAAAALRELGDPSAIPSLIDALVMTVKVPVPQSGAGTSASFATDGSNRLPGLSFGGNSPKYVKQEVMNRPVLEALVELCGGVNFG
ncbi:MAG: HEAT repeat domain-containing protein, partial [Planctomycetota bacterium]